jgi:alpha-L-arabinofuranosidase
MPKRLFVIFLAEVASIIALNAQPANAPAARISVSIDAGTTAPSISPYIYGQFIEHIGDLINRSLWAEMLDDRKFYDEINSKPSAGSSRGGRGRMPNRWRPIGPDDSVVMDRQHPYVGDHTPLIRPAGDTPEAFSRVAWRCAAGKPTPGASSLRAWRAPKSPSVSCGARALPPGRLFRLRG